jgi:hypothetical protein
MVMVWGRGSATLGQATAGVTVDSLGITSVILALLGLLAVGVALRPVLRRGTRPLVMLRLPPATAEINSEQAASPPTHADKHRISVRASGW